MLLQWKIFSLSNIINHLIYDSLEQDKEWSVSRYYLSQEHKRTFWKKSKSYSFYWRYPFQIVINRGEINWIFLECINTVDPFCEFSHAISKTQILKKSVGQANSHLLQPTWSSVLGAEAICFTLHPYQGVSLMHLVG